jgi:hypothetical protein
MASHLLLCDIMGRLELILIGLIGHLKTHFPTMYRLFLVLKDCDKPPTNDEIAIASGKKMLDPTKAAEYVVKLEKVSATLVDAFAKQNKQAVVHSLLFVLLMHCLMDLFQEANWDQDTFEWLLAEWMVECDQPFTEVDQPSF